MSLKISVLVIVLLFVNNSHEEEGNLADSSNEFCFDLLDTIPENENVFVSPASIYVALGMIYAGARGSTAQIMREVLKLNDTNLHQRFGHLIGLLNNGSQEYSLQMANALLYRQGYTIRSGFKRVLRNNYGALLKEVDFLGDNQKAKEEINNWVSEKTRQKIPEIINDLPSNLVMLLLNAVYFRGNWVEPFGDATDDTFYNEGINSVTVPMMALKERLPYGQFPDLGVDAIELPYKGEDISMLILLPTSFDKLSEIERSLDTEKLNRIVSNLRLSLFEVMVYLPKFKLEDSRNLNENLIDLGLGNLFENADFSGISYGSPPVSEVLHKSVIAVYEKGTEAAAVTSFGFTLSHAEIFYVNHPFLFFIRDRRTNLLLFAGRVNRL